MSAGPADSTIVHDTKRPEATERGDAFLQWVAVAFEGLATLTGDGTAASLAGEARSRAERASCASPRTVASMRRNAVASLVSAAAGYLRHDHPCGAAEAAVEALRGAMEEHPEPFSSLRVAAGEGWLISNSGSSVRMAGNGVAVEVMPWPCAGKHRESWVACIAGVSVASAADPQEAAEAAGRQFRKLFGNDSW